MQFPLSVTLTLPYTDPVDWALFQERIRAALAECTLASADLRRRPKFNLVLNPVGIPTPTAAKPDFRPDRTSSPILTPVAKEEEIPDGDAFLAAVTEVRGQTATWRHQQRIPPAPASDTVRGVLKRLPLEYSEAPIPAMVVHVSSIDKFFVQRYEDLDRLGDLALAIGRAQKRRLVSAPSAGTVVLANFQSGDGLWYRAEVVSSDDEKGKVKVRFVDYGNKDTVDVSHVAEMPGDLLECPQMAYRKDT